MSATTEQTAGGLDLTWRVAEVRPQDDLFRHVNGRWLDEVEIPEDRASASTFHDLHEAAELHLRAIVERAGVSRKADADAAKISDLYASFLDEDTVERLGVSPLAGDLAAIQAIDSLPALARELGRLQRRGVSGVFGAYVNTDARRSDRYVVYVSQGGLGLPDESYYREESFAEIRTAYLAHVETMLRLADLEDPAGSAQRIVDLETRLAGSHWDRVAARDAVRSYTLVERTGLDELVPAFDWTAWLEGLAAPESVLAEVVVRQPDFLRGLSAALTEIPLQDWKTWLSWRLVHAMSPLLAKAFSEESFAFYGTTLTGAPEQRERWKRGLDVVESSLGDALGKLYVAQHFPPHSKQLMLDLVANLVEAYRQDIEALDWMSPETKARALHKLQAFVPKIGYPDRWRDYTSVVIHADDLVGNIQRSDSFELDRELAKLGGPVDRTEWFMTPQTVNAYYNPGMNEVVFPAAILQPPFFDPAADPAVNYGGIGAVIGHEIGHGFDDQGSKYDGTGNLQDWWTESDRAAFDERAAALIAQFDALEPAQTPGQKVNGAMTVGENIGDLGGLTVAYKAYLLSLGGAEAPVVDGLTGPQRFFMSWARVWRGKGRDADVARRLAIDPHSPAEFRCNAIVRNLDEFVEAFGLAAEDALWLDPADRVRIW